MTAGDAAMFPVVGSGVLFSLYIMFKFFPKEYVNMLLAFYFSVVGLYTLTAFFNPFISKTFFAAKQKDLCDFSFTLPLFGKIEIKFNTSELISFFFAAIFAGLYFKTKHWTMNNFFGISFSIQGIKSLSLGNYKTGAMLLVGLFFYDIFWVFGTDVMVTVAKSFDAPIKLLFPRSFATADAKAQFSMLGLGDIVIPGIFVALLLRFDAQQAKVKSASDPFEQPYFHTTMLGYTLGLITTVVVMYAFEAAQPALLYLVPACLGASMITAIARGEVGELFAFSEEEEEAKDDSKKKK
jgi:minor histocompatibility antigen H13